MLAFVLSFLLQLQVHANSGRGAAPMVQIFIAEWCVHCRDLEKYLRDNSVPYVSYDIERDAEGRALYERLGGGGVPLVRIGSTIIRGFDRNLLDRALSGSQAELPNSGKPLPLKTTSMVTN